MTKSLYKQIIVEPAQVQARIDELADEIVERYKDKNPLFVCLLRGGAPFSTQLMFAIVRKDPNFQPELDYMTVKTYGDGRNDNPTELIMDLSPNTKVAGRQVILLDDVLDKGVTADFAQNHLLGKQASAVDLVVLVKKDRSRENDIEATLFGFTGPAGWLTGMGLDDARIALEGNRWADYIAIANDEE